MTDKEKMRAEIERLRKQDGNPYYPSKTADQYYARGVHFTCDNLLNFINSLPEDPIDGLLDMSKIDIKIQYASIDAGIHAHAEDYSFNIESELFNQLTKEQQILWRKEIEQAVISGGYNGFDLAKDQRYKENSEVKEVDLEKDIQRQYNVHKNPNNSIVKDCVIMTKDGFEYFAKHFFELGLKAQKGE